MTHVSDPEFPLEAMEKVIADTVGAANFSAVPATRIATALLGDSIATNLFMVGYAWQQGKIPLRAESILKAIEMNKAAVEMNKAAFLWGRRAAVDLAMVEEVAVPRAALPDQRVLSTESRRNGRAPHEPSSPPGKAAATPGATNGWDMAGARGGSESCARPQRTPRGRGALLLQAPRLQRRIRGRAPLHANRFPPARRRHVRWRLQGDAEPGAAFVGTSRQDHRRAAQAGIRPRARCRF